MAKYLYLLYSKKPSWPHWRTEHIIRPLFPAGKPVDPLPLYRNIHFNIQYPSSMPLFRWVSKRGARGYLISAILLEDIPKPFHGFAKSRSPLARQRWHIRHRNWWRSHSTPSLLSGRDGEFSATDTTVSPAEFFRRYDILDCRNRRQSKFQLARSAVTESAHVIQLFKTLLHGVFPMDQTMWGNRLSCVCSCLIS